MSLVDARDLFAMRREGVSPFLVFWLALDRATGRRLRYGQAKALFDATLEAVNAG